MSESARELFYDEKLNNRKFTGGGMKKRQKKKTASDEEYDHLAKKVWRAKHHASTSDHFCDRGEEIRIGNTEGIDGGYEKNLQNASEVTIVGCTCSNKAKEIIVLSESDETDDRIQSKRRAR